MKFGVPSFWPKGLFVLNSPHIAFYDNKGFCLVVDKVNRLIEAACSIKETER